MSKPKFINHEQSKLAFEIFMNYSLPLILNCIVNKEQIISNACSSKLRPLRVYILTTPPLVLQYDIIIPRRGKSKLVIDSILKNENLRLHLKSK